jgi:hypothetical protein
MQSTRTSAAPDNQLEHELLLKKITPLQMLVDALHF